jgi:beta-lactamase class D
MSSIPATNQLNKKHLKTTTATTTILDNTDTNSNRISNNKENTILTTTSNYQVNNTYFAYDTQTLNNNVEAKKNQKVTLAQPLSETLLYDPKLVIVIFNLVFL